MDLMKQFTLGVIRHGLTTAGGALVTQGVVSAGEAEQAVGAVMVLVGLAWSLWRKYERAHA